MVYLGTPCPDCKKEGLQLLATTNELEYYCPHCDKRFTKKEVYDDL